MHTHDQHCFTVKSAWKSYLQWVQLTSRNHSSLRDSAIYFPKQIRRKFYPLQHLQCSSLLEQRISPRSLSSDLLRLSLLLHSNLRLFSLNSRLFSLQRQSLLLSLSRRFLHHLQRLSHLHPPMKLSPVIDNKWNR